jgi:acetylornithine deacetylase/succinyl-diaminopimelate desuccinylase-like protein
MDGPWDAYLAEHEGRHLAELHDLLRIPSVSALPAHRDDVGAAGEWVAARLRAAGVPEVEVLPPAPGGHPLVLGRWRVGEERPTALIYAHYDVQPPDPLDLWETPPFEPTVRDGRIYARGAADDKAGLFLTIAAVEALARTGGAPPLNLVFFFEGEEEIGSPSLAPLIRAQRERLACDTVVSADGAMFGPETPSLMLSTKGLAGCQIDVRTGRTDLHSGEYGAAVANAAQAIARLVASLHTPEGRVAVEGFYDRVREPTAEERAELAKVPWDEAAFTDEAGTAARWGEPGWTPLERRWLRPTVDVNGVWGGFQGEGAKTVTPCGGHAKLTCRLVPDQEPAEIVRLLERHVAAHTPPGVEATVTALPGSARPFAIRRDDPALLAAGRVLREQSGKEPLLTRTGGTLPVAELFQRELGADMVFFAWSLPGCNAHAPNEWFRIEDFRRGARAYCAYLTALGAELAPVRGDETRSRG